MSYKNWIENTSVLHLYNELINLKFVQLENLPIEERITMLHNELMARKEVSVIEATEQEALTRFCERFYM